LIRKEAVPVILDVRLRTGFYETEPYRLSIGRGMLELLPEKTGAEPLILPEGKILSVTRFGKRCAGAEIQTEDRLYHVTLCDSSRAEELYQSLKENLRVGIEVESAYEGGR
jgi:hypothetical protein